MAMSAQAAEIYNKDRNKLDLYGKLMLSTTSPLMMQMMVILLMPVLASKGETQINDQLTGFGQWKWNQKATALNLKVPRKTKPASICRPEIR
ncbi:porin [Escherichia coli]